MKIETTKPLNVCRKSFTLVELLVVIAIIGVLAALLLPAVGTAKDRAKAVICAHNEKRIGEAFNSYVTDNNGFYPYAYPNCGAINNCACGPPINAVSFCTTGSSSCASGAAWNVPLAQYYGFSKSSFTTRIQFNLCQVNCGWGGCGPPTSQICQDITGYSPFIQCPSNPWQIPTGIPWDCGNPNWVNPGFPQSAGNGAGWSIFPTTYAMNVDGFPTTWGTSQGAACASPVGFYKCMNISDINHPSSLALIGEMPWMQWLVPNPSLPSNWGLNYGLPGKTALMSAARVGGANPAASYIWTNLTKYAYCNGYMAAWHGKRMNTLFPDGHVEQVSQSTLTNYSDQYLNTTATTSPGWLFFNDGKATNWYANQFPGYNLPLSFQ